MTTATMTPRNFSAGMNYPSPVVQIIGLGYYDGVTNGVLRTVDGSVYAFDMIGETLGSEDDDDVRRFELKPLPQEVFQTIVSAIAPYHKPEWPCWIPLWKFPTPEAQNAANKIIEEQLSRAAAPEWVIEATDLSRDVLSAHRASGNEHSEPGKAYARLLLQLDYLKRSGREHSHEGATLREVMNELWPRLTPAERSRLTGLAEDLRMLASGGPQMVEMSPSEVQEYWVWKRDAWTQRKAGQHDAVLGALRRPHPAGIVPRYGVLFIQSRLWADLGLPEVAIELLKVAEREEPRLLVVTLSLLEELGQSAEARTYAERILAELPNDTHACYQACATIVIQATSRELSQRAVDLVRVIPILRDLRNRIDRDASNEAPIPGLGISIGCLLACALELHGEQTASESEYDWVIARFPSDPDAWEMRGYLRRIRNDPNALSDFQEAIKRGARSGLPYVLTALATIHTNPAESLAIVNRAENVLSSFRGPIGAALYELRAFAKLTLGQSSPRVLEDLDLALTLQPENAHLRRNREAIAIAGRPEPPPTIPIESVKLEQQRVLRELSNKAAQHHETLSVGFWKQPA